MTQSSISIEHLQWLTDRLPNPYRTNMRQGDTYRMPEATSMMAWDPSIGASCTATATYHEFTIEETRDRRGNKFLRWAYRGKVLV